VAPIIAVLSMYLALRHSCGTYNFEVAPNFFLGGKFMGPCTCIVFHLQVNWQILYFSSLLFLYIILLVYHHHVQEGLGLIPVPCILKMKLVPPSLPRSSYVSSS